MKGVSLALRQASAVVPTEIKLSLPVNFSAPGVLGTELESWEDRIRGLVRAPLNPTSLLLRVNCIGEAFVPLAVSHAVLEAQPELNAVVQGMHPMLSCLVKLLTITHADVELPLHMRVGGWDQSYRCHFRYTLCTARRLSLREASQK
jgi:hypothetical protein